MTVAELLTNRALRTLLESRRCLRRASLPSALTPNTVELIPSREALSHPRQACLGRKWLQLYHEGAASG